MRRVSLATAIVMCGAATAAVIIRGAHSHSSPARGGAILRVDTIKVVLSPAEAGAHRTARFGLYNDGSEALLLSDPQTTCDCLEAALSVNLVPPGGVAELRVKVEVPPVGRRESTVHIVSNSLINRSVTLSVVVESNTAAPYVERQHEGLRFSGWLETGASQDAFVQTVEERGAALWLQSFDADLRFLNVRVRGVEEEPHQDDRLIRRHYHLEVSVTDVPEVSLYRGQVWAIANTGELPVASIPVLVERKEPIEAVPRSLYVVAENRVKTYRVVVCSYQPDFTLEITVDDVPDGIEVKPIDVGGERVRQFEVRVGPTAISGAVRMRRAVIRLGTNHPAIPELTVPVLYRRLDADQ